MVQQVECARCGDVVGEDYELDDNGAFMCAKHKVEDMQDEFAEQYHDED